MLTDALKQEIQRAYSGLLEAKGHKPRYGQRVMIAEIARTLGAIEVDDDGKRTSQSHICVIEAGTGTGKTVGYLLAALPIAKAAGKKLIISTATVALQEQIIHKDLPDLLKHSPLNFTYALAKGRSRYLCLNKLETVLEADPGNPNLALFEQEAVAGMDEAVSELYRSLGEEYAANRWDGDRDSWPQVIEPELWQKVTTDHRQCANRRCSNFSACSFYRARKDIDGVDCIVANHDLVLADLALGGGAVLPPPKDCIYIFDEGHHLPDKAIDHFTYTCRVNGTVQWLRQIGKTLAKLIADVGNTGEVGRQADKIPPVVVTLDESLGQTYRLLHELARFETMENTGNQLQYRFAHGVVPEALQTLASNIRGGFSELYKALNLINETLKKALGEDNDTGIARQHAEAWFPVIGFLLARAEASLALWSAYATPDDPEEPPSARWLLLVDAGQDVDIEVCASPILASRALYQSLWSQCHGAVVTSATLTALGNFERLKLRAGIPRDSRFQQVPSPFDYARAGVLSIPPMTADPSSSDAHTEAVIRCLDELIDPTEGSLVLFSSRRQLRDVRDGVSDVLQQRILTQDDASKQEILRRHRERIEAGEGSVLFGLASFAEGIDLPGDYLTHVIIAKIPFAVPDAPVEAALAEWIEQRGGNPFMQISVPDASIRLVQACGRLLRTETDQGRITLLDRRLLSRRYGQALLDALPPFRREFA